MFLIICCFPNFSTMCCVCFYLLTPKLEKGWKVNQCLQFVILLYKCVIDFQALMTLRNQHVMSWVSVKSERNDFTYCKHLGGAFSGTFKRLLAVPRFSHHFHQARETIHRDNIRMVTSSCVGHCGQKVTLCYRVKGGICDTPEFTVGSSGKHLPRWKHLM